MISLHQCCHPHYFVWRVASEFSSNCSTVKIVQCFSECSVQWLKCRPIGVGIFSLMQDTWCVILSCNVRPVSPTYCILPFLQVTRYKMLLHRVSENRPTFTTCYNFYIRSSIATIFGTSIAEKVGNQNILYFPSSPNWCFCTTWGNRKPGNCVFSLKCCMLFHQKHETRLKISPGQSWTTLHCQNDRLGAPDRTI